MTTETDRQVKTRMTRYYRQVGRILEMSKKEARIEMAKLIKSLNEERNIWFEKGITNQTIDPLHTPTDNLFYYTLGHCLSKKKKYVSIYNELKNY